MTLGPSIDIHIEMLDFTALGPAANGYKSSMMIKRRTTGNSWSRATNWKDNTIKVNKLVSSSVVAKWSTQITIEINQPFFLSKWKTGLYWTKHKVTQGHISQLGIMIKDDQTITIDWTGRKWNISTHLI